jgi:hypothetical protein
MPGPYYVLLESGEPDRILLEGSSYHVLLEGYQVHSIEETDTAVTSSSEAVLITGSLTDINASDTATHISTNPDYAELEVAQGIWPQYILNLLPWPWTSDVAKANGGKLYGLAQALGLAFSLMNGLIAYVKPQTRIATATDTNLEAIATDYLALPSGLFVRPQEFIGGEFVPESDSDYSAAIRAKIIAKVNTIAAIQTVVEEYFALNPDGSESVTVFDYMTNPSLFTSLGVPRNQSIFVIQIEYPPSNETDGFFLGQNDYLGQTTWLGSGQNQPTPFSPYPLLEQAVNDVRLAGSKPYWYRTYS